MRVRALQRAASSVPSLLGSLALVASVWCLVLIGHVLSERLDHEVWTACAFAAAVLIVVAVRPRRPSSAPVVPVLLGLGSGFVSYPAWVTTIWQISRSSWVFGMADSLGL